MVTDLEPLYDHETPFYMKTELERYKQIIEIVISLPKKPFWTNGAGPGGLVTENLRMPAQKTLSASDLPEFWNSHCPCQADPIVYGLEGCKTKDADTYLSTLF